MESKESWVRTQASAKKHYVVLLECKTKPKVGSFQSCYVSVSYLDKKIEKIKLGIKGTMPEHHHGLPSSPEISWSESEKRYLIHGLKFSMPGEWLLHIYINGSENRPKDIAYINIVL